MKKVLSVLLSVIMIFSMGSAAFASLTEGCTCGFSPIIYVGPLGCSSIVRDAGTDDAQQLWKIDTGYLLSNLSSVLPDLTKALLTRNTDLLGDALVKFINDCFGDLALDSEGESKENVTTPELNVPKGDRHGPDSDYYFDYDFRLDPFAHAERLHDFIAQVKELTGHNTVKLKCSSMGGVVLSAYLEKYGSEDIDVIIARCCPFKGTAVAGEAFTGKLEINSTSLTRYGEDAIPFLDGGFEADFLESFLYVLLDTLKGVGVIDGICALGDKLIKDLGDRIYDEALVPIFGTLPGIWSFVPEEYFDDAVEFMNLPEEGGLHDQIFAYRTAMANIGENLMEAKENGTEICIICGYNVQRTPLVTLWKSTSDGTVDTKYASIGATCGDVKEPLSSDYLSAMDDRTYLSPDNMIDASTCVMPDNTWFVRDWLHCNGNKGIDELFNLVMTTEDVSVSSFEKFPQFLVADDDADTVTPLKAGFDELSRLKDRFSLLNLVRYIFSLFKNAADRVKNIFSFKKADQPVAR